MVFNAISVFNLKLYNLFFFGTEETVDLDTIGCATYDVKMTKLKVFPKVGECYYLCTLEKPFKMVETV